MKRIALSFLGTSDYGLTKYRIDGAVYENRFIQQVIREHFKVDSHLIFCTQKAKDMHGESLLKLGYAPDELISIPDGKSEEELWQLFEIITKHVPEKASLVFDVTHGFRIQPMLALATLVFLRFHKNVKVKGIYYGLFEKGEGIINDVLDITPFLDLIDWSFAIRRFQEKGDAGDLAAIMNAYHKRTYVENRSYKAEKLANAGSLFKALMEELAVIRPQQAIESATKLFTISNELKLDLEHISQTKPLSMILASARDEISGFMVPEMEPGELFSPEGILAQYNICLHYIKVGKYQQCLTLATEMLIGVTLMLHEEDPLDEEKRTAMSRRLQSIHKGKHIGPKLDWEDVAAPLLRFAADTRNDINHAGMRKDPKSAKSFIRNAEEILDQIHDFLIAQDIIQTGSEEV